MGVEFFQIHVTALCAQVMFGKSRLFLILPNLHIINAAINIDPQVPCQVAEASLTLLMLLAGAIPQAPPFLLHDQLPPLSFAIFWTDIAEAACNQLPISAAGVAHLEK